MAPCANATPVLCGSTYQGVTSGVPHSMPANACPYNGAASTGGQLDEGAYAVAVFLPGLGWLSTPMVKVAAGVLMALAAYPVLAAFKRRVDHRNYNGAALLGLRGLVFKSHGSADAVAFECALRRAYDAAHHQLLDNVKTRLERAATLLAASDPKAAASNAA